MDGLKNATLKRRFLYLIVAEFPYGHGEIFLRDEIGYLATEFEHIYLVIPDSSKISSTSNKTILPVNVSTCKLNTRISWIGRFACFPKALKQFLGREEKEVVDKLNPENKWPLFRILLGYWALANSFKYQLNRLLKTHNHNPSETTLYSYWFFYPTIALAEIKNRNSEYRVISRMHGWDCFFERSPYNYLPLRPYVISRLDALSSISRTGVEYTREKLKGLIPENKLIYSYLGIKTQYDASRRTEDKEKLHLVSVAYISPVKRLNRIAEALASWDGKKIIWEHIGCASNGNADFEFAVLSQFENHPNVEINFLGELNQTQLFDFFSQQQPDLLICTSQSEGIPVSMMEAMAHGIPVLSVNVGGIGEIVSHEKNGFLMAANATSKEICEALQHYIDLSQQEKVTLRENANDTFVQKFKAENNYRQFIQNVLND